MSSKQDMKREDEQWVEISHKWLTIHREIAIMEAEERALREMLIQMAGTQNVTGGGVRLTRSLRKGSIQYSQIPELEQVDLEKYRKEPVEMWRLVPSDR